MNFGQALEILKQGRRVARTNWNGAHMWIRLEEPDEGSLMKRPYLYIRPVGGGLVPWVASQTDVLAEDWFEYH